MGTLADPDADYAVAYGFDAHGRLDSITDPSQTFAYGYLADSNLIETMTSPVHSTAYTYEDERNVKTVVDNKLTGGTTSVSSYTYAYDALGRRTSRVQQGTAFTQASFDAFDYNDRSEVIDSKRYLGTDVSDLTNPVVADNFGYNFDPIGNRVQSSAGILPATTYTSNELNQYTQVSALSSQPSHDPDGNLTEQGDWIYKWNAENRLIEAYSFADDKKLEFVYDYLGRRVEKKVTEISTSTVTSEERFLYDGWNLIAVYDPANADALVKTHTWGLDLSQTLQDAGGVGGLLGLEELSGSHQGVYAFTFDANGNVSEVLDDTGAVAAHYEYSPFGEVIRSSGSYADANVWRFSTKYFDTDTELYYYGFRYYDPVTGRWPNRDPIGELGGLNLYGFVGNNGIYAWDYLGLYDLGDFFEDLHTIFSNYPDGSDEGLDGVMDFTKDLGDGINDELDAQERDKKLQKEIDDLKDENQKLQEKINELEEAQKRKKELDEALDELREETKRLEEEAKKLAEEEKKKNCN